MTWDIHDRLSAHMTATGDCERAYRLGVQDAFAMRQISTLDLDAAAAKCAKRAMQQPPENHALPSADNHGCGRLLSDGALD